MFRTLFTLTFIVSINSAAQNFWEPTNGPYGPNEINRMFIAGNGTIYLYGDSLIKSTDNGNTWTGIPDSTLAFQSFLASDNGDLYGGDFQAVYRSTNGGVNWIPCNLGISPISAQTLASNSKGDIFVGTNNQVFRSTNNGTSWNRFTSGMSGATVYRFAFGTDTTVIAACYQGLFRSTNNGANWNLVGEPLIFRHIAKLKTGTIIAGGDRGMWRSTDNGITWTNVTSALPDTIITSLGGDSSGNGYCMISTTGILKSTNDGITWNNISENFYYPSADAFCAKSDGNVFTLTRAALFHSTDNGVSWNSVNAQFPPFGARYVFVNPTGTIFLGSFGGNFRSTDNGNTWTAINNGLINKMINGVEVALNGNLVGGSYGGTMHYSSNNGDTWHSAGFTGSVNGMVKTSNGDLYVATSNSVHKSTDNGLSWAPDSIGAGKQYLNCIAVTSNNDLYVGGNFGVWKKGGNETIWTHVLGETSFFGSSSIVSLANGNILASITFTSVATDKGVYKSTDNGVSWDRIVTPDSNFSKMVINSIGQIYAAGKLGIHKSTDGGSSWTTVAGTVWPATTKSSVSVNSMAFGESGVLYAATSARVYRSSQSTTNIPTIGGVTPSHFELEQNYPNPFNPNTSIKFSLPQTQFVTLKVFDAIGKEVGVLVNETLEAGAYEAKFQSLNFSSGMYFYRLKAGSHTSTKKMILLK